MEEWWGTCSYDRFLPEYQYKWVNGINFAILMLARSAVIKNMCLSYFLGPPFPCHQHCVATFGYFAVISRCLPIFPGQTDMKRQKLILLTRHLANYSVLDSRSTYISNLVIFLLPIHRHHANYLYFKFFFNQGTVIISEGHVLCVWALFLALIAKTTTYRRKNKTRPLPLCMDIEV